MSFGYFKAYFVVLYLGWDGFAAAVDWEKRKEGNEEGVSILMNGLFGRMRISMG